MSIFSAKHRPSFASPEDPIDIPSTLRFEVVAHGAPLEASSSTGIAKLPNVDGPCDVRVDVFEQNNTRGSKLSFRLVSDGLQTRDAIIGFPVGDMTVLETVNTLVNTLCNFLPAEHPATLRAEANLPLRNGPDWEAEPWQWEIPSSLADVGYALHEAHRRLGSIGWLHISTKDLSVDFCFLEYGGIRHDGGIKASQEWLKHKQNREIMRSVIEALSTEPLQEFGATAPPLTKPFVDIAIATFFEKVFLEASGKRAPLFEPTPLPTSYRDNGPSPSERRCTDWGPEWETFELRDLRRAGYQTALGRISLVENEVVHQKRFRDGKFLYPFESGSLLSTHDKSLALDGLSLKAHLSDIAAVFEAIHKKLHRFAEPIDAAPPLFFIDPLHPNGALAVQFISGAPALLHTALGTMPLTVDLLTDELRTRIFRELDASLGLQPMPFRCGRTIKGEGLGLYSVGRGSHETPVPTPRFSERLDFIQFNTRSHYEEAGQIQLLAVWDSLLQEFKANHRLTSPIFW